MSRQPLVVHPDMTLRDAWMLMDSHGIASCPVVTGSDELRGIISRVDLLRAFRPSRELAPAEVRQAGHLPVREVMHCGVVTVRTDDHLAAAVDRFVESRMHLLPVVGPGAGGNHVVGIITQGDVLRHLVLGEPSGA
jgi:CBS-domain-containing membrane protein